MNVRVFQYFVLVFTFLFKNNFLSTTPNPVHFLPMILHSIVLFTELSNTQTSTSIATAMPSVSQNPDLEHIPLRGSHNLNALRTSFLLPLNIIHSLFICFDLIDLHSIGFLSLLGIPITPSLLWFPFIYQLASRVHVDLQKPTKDMRVEKLHRWSTTEQVD